MLVLPRPEQGNLLVLFFAPKNMDQTNDGVIFRITQFFSPGDKLILYPQYYKKLLVDPHRNIVFVGGLFPSLERQCFLQCLVFFLGAPRRLDLLLLLT